MIWWIVLWLGRTSGGGPAAPTPVALPFLTRDGVNLGALPTFTRRTS